MNKRTPKEIEHDGMMPKVLNKFIEFVGQYANVTVLRCQGEEADDMIARFCYLYTEDKIIYLYNGRNHCLITFDGLYDMENEKQRMKKNSIDNTGKFSDKKRLYRKYRFRITR